MAAKSGRRARAVAIAKVQNQAGSVWGLLLVGLSVLILTGVAGCSREPAAGGAAVAAVEFKNDDGTVTSIPAVPKKILSTSTSITGTLLAIDAPVVASASAGNGKFFGQWSKVAEERGVQNIWPAGNVNIEAAIAAQPDLIIVSTGGADSAMQQIAELRQIAPVIVLDYGAQSWQQLAIRLGQATGLEDKAKARVAAFDAYVAEAKTKLSLPPGKTNIISYNGPGTTNPIGVATGSHGQLLTALGFDIESPDPAWHAGVGDRTDFIWAPYENLSRLKASTTFLVRADAKRVEAFKKDSVLANLPSVRDGRVYNLGPNSFRIDYYSATEIVDEIVKTFPR